MKISLVSLFFVLLFGFANSAYSQKPKLQSIKYDTVRGRPVMDKNFNIYQAGVYIDPNNSVRSWQITKLDAQQNFLWTKNYQRIPTRSGGPLSLVTDDSCNIYVTGYYEQTSYRDEAITMKLDSTGNIKWIVVEPAGINNDMAEKIILGKDGYLYVAGSSWRLAEDEDLFLIKFNTSGEKIWKKVYNTVGVNSNAYDNYSDLTVDDFGNSYIAFEMRDEPHPNKASLLKYDTDGNLKFVYNNFDYYLSFTESVTVFKNKNIYVVGGVQDSDTNQTKVILHKLDSSGAMGWKKVFTKSGEFRNRDFEVICDIFGNAYLGGLTYAQRSTNPSTYESYLALLKYNPVGDLEWSRFKTGGISSSPGNYFGMNKDKYGSVYVQGSLYFPVTFLDGLTIKYSDAGDEIWTIKYHHQDSSYDFSQFQLFYPNNDFLIVGGYTTNSNPSITKIAYLRYSQPVKIENIGNTVPDKFELSQNYPNPFNLHTKIKFNIVQKDVYVLKLYDISGREVMRMSFDNLSPGSYQYTFNMNNYASGNYFYELSTNKERIVKQMLLIK